MPPKSTQHVATKILCNLCLKIKYVKMGSQDSVILLHSYITVHTTKIIIIKIVLTSKASLASYIAFDNTFSFHILFQHI